MESFIISIVIFTAIYAVFSLGLNLQWGFTGLLNFGHVAFMTVGAYTTVLLSMAGVPLAIAALAGGAIAALLGLLIGLSTLRLRTDYLAIVTIGISELIRLVAVNEQWLTRGTLGLQRFPLPLATFNPNLLLRIGMIAVLTTIVGLAYRQLWQWLRLSVKGISSQALLTRSSAALIYLGSLTLVLSGIGITAKQLKLANTIPAWGLGLMLLGAIALTCGFYIWLGKFFSARISDWAKGLSLIFTLVCAAIGLCAFGYASAALYHYDNNPSKTGLMWVSVLTVALVYWGLEKLVRSPWGRVLKAIREDEEIAKALGKNVFWYKLQSLMLGGFCAGIAGALYAWQLTIVYPDNFFPLITFNAWTIIVLGGAGSNVGTLLGATIFWGYDSITRFILKDIVPLDDASLGSFRIMVIGLILIGLMRWRPQGILGKQEELSLGR
jgi:neutral amino acid transport system permease protein